MNKEVTSTIRELPKGVMLNAYPDSIARNLADIVDLLKRPELKDLSEMDKLGINLKFDLVLNHLSVGSPQFQDMLKNGDDSPFKDFFVDWNEFWGGHGEMGDDGYIIPKQEYLQKLFMRKPGLPILKVRFPDGSDRPYWNTFYQEVTYQEITGEDLAGIEGLTPDQAESIVAIVNEAIRAKSDFVEVDLGEYARYKDDVIAIVERKRNYLGQMDLNAKSEGVWDFYDETFKKLHDFGAKLVRLDAFAYLHKEPGKTNFFNKPGTWDYLERLKQIAKKYDLFLLPEIHSEYGTGLYEEVAGKGYPIYDFFFPGLVIDALDRGTNTALLRWTREIIEKDLKTINMLGCHDGIPVLDLKGKEVSGVAKPGLMTDEEIDAIIERVINRGGRVKNLYGPDGTKISYYQVNATFFSALGEDEQTLLLARAIQMFMPGIPQVWYLDLFAGKNNYEAADGGGVAGHKEINRTTLANAEIEEGLKRPIVLNQLELMRLRNTSPAFNGELEIGDTDEHHLHMTWKNGACSATLVANLQDHSFTITHTDDAGEERLLSFS